MPIMLLMHKGYKQQDFIWFRFGIDTLQNCDATKTWKSGFIG